MSDDNELEQNESDLEQLFEMSEEQFQDCQIRSALRVAREATRTSKSRGLAIQYMRGLFDQMRYGHGVLDPKSNREATVELLALLEDEEHARRIQPDLNEGEYQWLCTWMSACAYDNLAESTGLMSGYNSAGMHECINDGIQICRQTGKLECIKCFREYAADVYLSSDDLAMVRHQCQELMKFREDDPDEKDRRWSAHDKLAWISLLEGRLESTVEALTTALPLTQADKVYLKLRAKLLVAVSLDQALLLAGHPRFDWTEIEQAGEIPEAGEWPKFELERAKANCVAHVMAGDLESAIEGLTDWDRQLTELQCTKEWFEIRLRLIAAYLISTNRKRAEALAKGLEAKASEAQDFLTLRRLARLMSPGTIVGPVPTLNDLEIGPFTGKPVPDATENAPTSDTEVSATEPAEDDAVTTPLAETLITYMQQILEYEEDEEAQSQLFDTILSHVPASIEHPGDAAYLVHLSRFLIRGPEMARRAWEWSVLIKDRFPDHAKVLSVVADLGYYFHTADPIEFTDIDVTEVEEMYKLSLSLDVNDARNHARAAAFYFAEDQMGEAERCYARAFRLDRTDGSIAQSLADLYQQTDRPRDALAVLDLCLREGSEDANVAWEAAMIALQLEQFDLVLTYLDRFEELGEPQTWLYYYRASALIQLGRFAECLSALELEAGQDPPGDFHLKAVRTCALIYLKRDEEARVLLHELLDMPMREIDYLSMNGLGRILGQVWEAVSKWSSDDPQRLQVEQCVLECGLAPDEYFEERRLTEKVQEELHFYRLQLEQPLSENWRNSPGCLPDQKEWTFYTILWGVLSPNEDDAVRRVMQYQAHHESEAKVIDVDESEETYRDRPGVVWQGMRWMSEESEDEFDLEDESH